MTDHKFTDDEIVMLLRAYAEMMCRKCIVKDLGTHCESCFITHVSQAVDLINRQKAEIERLQSALERANYYGLKADEEIEHLKAEIEATEEECADMLGQRNAVKMMLESNRAEAIKEFAKKIKTDAERICDDNYIEGALIKYVDTLVKEMTEGKNESQSTKTVGGVIPARSGEA